MKIILLLLCALFSISTFAEGPQKKVFVQFNIDRESKPNLLIRTQEIRDSLSQALTEKNYIEVSNEAEAEVKLVLNASFGVEPYQGILKSCDGFLSVSNTHSPGRHLSVSFGKTGILIGAKRCAKKVKELFEDIPSSEFFQL